jgi:hypothetical protein
MSMGHSINKVMYYMILLPLFMALLATFLPDTSLNIGFWLMGVLLVDFIWLFLSRVRSMHENHSWRIVCLVIQMDLFAAFTLLLNWRYWGEPTGLAITLVIVFVIIAFLGYKNRRIVLQEGISPRTKLGKIIYAAGFIGGGVAGVISYSAMRSLNGIVDSSVLGMVFVNVMSVFALVLVLFFQATLLKIEEPSWNPHIEL